MRATNFSEPNEIMNKIVSHVTGGRLWEVAEWQPTEGKSGAFVSENGIQRIRAKMMASPEIIDRAHALAAAEGCSCGSCTRHVAERIITEILDQAGLGLMEDNIKFAKRIAKIAKDMHGTKIDPVLAGVIGTIANEDAVRGGKYLVSFSNRTQWTNGRFGKTDSCWWTCYTQSRATFDCHGGLGMRFHNYPGEGESVDIHDGYARIWIAPVTNNTCVMFNAYGVELDRVAAALAEQLGLRTRRVTVYNERDQSRPFINGNSGMALSSTTPNSEYILNWNTESYDDEHICERCSSSVHNDEAIRLNGYYYCPTCVVACTGCGKLVSVDDAPTLDGVRYCQDCVEVCAGCHSVHKKGELWHVPYKINEYLGYSFPPRLLCRDCMDGLIAHYERAKAQREAERERMERATERTGSRSQGWVISTSGTISDSLAGFYQAVQDARERQFRADFVDLRNNLLNDIQPIAGLDDDDEIPF